MQSAKDPVSLQEIYKDTEACAKLVGLVYSSDQVPGYTRKKRGKGFEFFDDSNRPLQTRQLKKRLAELVIPPAWKDVWISPDDNGHILVTGIDEQGRKQYIYNPKWRTMRDLLKFYRMITFARALPRIRKTIDDHLALRGLDFYKVIGGMLWILDNTYIRIGNDVYFNENDSKGLTTLSDHNAIIAGSVVTFSYKGKSNQQRQLTVDHPAIAKIVRDSRAIRGDRLFQYKDKTGKPHPITATDINSYLQEISGQQITAKDFRTWGGTLLAFDHLVNDNSRTKKTKSKIIDAVDKAASILGNTRAVAKSSYIHPHILGAYGSRDFNRYYRYAKKQRKIPKLDRRETELIYFLEQLFKNEFDLLRTS